MSERLARRGVFAGMFALAVLPGLLGGYWALREVQYRFIPIVTDFTLTERVLSEDGESLTLAGHFIKRFRGDICRYDGMQWYVRLSGKADDIANLRVRHDTRPLGLAVAVGHEFGDVRETERENNRPKGWQPFSNWYVHVGEWPDATFALGRVYHKCLGIWPTVTDFAPVDYADLRSVSASRD